MLNQSNGAESVQAQPALTAPGFGTLTKKLTHSAEKCAYNTRAGYGIIPGMKKCRIVKIISMMKKGSKIIISRKEKSNGKT